MDSGPLRLVPTQCLKIDVFLFFLVHWNVLCTIILRAALIVTANNVLFLIDYITLHNFRLVFLSAYFYFGFLCVPQARYEISVGNG